MRRRNRPAAAPCVSRPAQRAVEGVDLARQCRRLALQQVHHHRQPFAFEARGQRADAQGGDHAAVGVEHRHRDAGHAFDEAGVGVGITLAAHLGDFGAQVHLVERAEVADARHVVAHHLVALGLGQVGQDRHRALAHAQRHAAADVAGEAADRERALPAVQAHRVEAGAHQQEDAVAERRAKAQQCRPAALAQVAGVAGARGQREEVQAQRIALAGHLLFDQAFVDQLLQQAVRGGLREAQGLAEVADTLAAVGSACGQCTQDLHGPVQARDRAVVFRHGSRTPEWKCMNRSK